MSSKRFWDWFIFPGGLWIALLFAIPLFLVLALSFGHVDDLGRGVYGFTLDNYRDVFDATYVPVLLRSVGYALVTVILCLLIGYPVAYFIAHASQATFPVQNGGDAAILFCFVFLYLAAVGGGPWALDNVLFKKKKG